MDEIIYGIFKVQYDFALDVWSKSIKQYNISSDELLNYSLICKWAAIGRCLGCLCGTINHVFKRI